MTQIVPPQPTTSFSTFSPTVDTSDGVESPWCEIESLSLSSELSSTHSARAFQTLAISSHPGRFGRSIWLIRFQANSESDESKCRFVRIIFIPSSLTQVTYFPDSDHLIVLIEPSPLCSMVSLPVFAPRPREPSQPDAAAAAPPIVVEVVLVPARPPTVKIKFPARPPDK